MAWFKVDDHFWGHPKRLACTPAEIGLWVTAGSWSAQQLTDGQIPTHVLPFFGAKPKDAAGLVRAGLWVTTDTGWQFHDWHLFQPSRAEVEQGREEAAARKKAWREKRAAERAAEKKGAKGNADVPVGHVRDTSVPERPRDVHVPSVSQGRPTYPDPDPTRPDPDPTRSSLREERKDPSQTLLLTASGDERGPTPFDEFWIAYPRKVAKIDARKAYSKARKTATHEAIVSGAVRFAADRTRDQEFTPYPASWLNDGRWEDEGPVRPTSNIRPITGRIAEGDEILREAFNRGQAQRLGQQELGA